MWESYNQLALTPSLPLLIPPSSTPPPRSLQQHLSDVRQQAMYAVVHGGLSLELRRQSVDYLTQLPFDGYAVGGSLGKDRCAAGPALVAQSTSLTACP